MSPHRPEDKHVKRAKIVAADAAPLRKDNRFAQLVSGSGLVTVTGLVSKRSARRANATYQQRSASKPSDPHQYLFAPFSEDQHRPAKRPTEFKVKGIGMVMFDTLEDGAECEVFDLLLLLERPPSAQ